jgi:hypothetical protein
MLNRNGVALALGLVFVCGASACSSENVELPSENIGQVQQAASQGEFLRNSCMGPDDWIEGAGGYLYYQADGNLVLYTPQGQAVWASNTFGAPGMVCMQLDSNLVIYNASGQPVWSSGTAWNIANTQVRVTQCSQGFRVVVFSPNYAFYPMAAYPPGAECYTGCPMGEQAPHCNPPACTEVGGWCSHGSECCSGSCDPYGQCSYIMYPEP